MKKNQFAISTNLNIKMHAFLLNLNKNSLKNRFCVNINVRLAGKADTYNFKRSIRK